MTNRRPAHLPVRITRSPSSLSSWVSPGRRPAGDRAAQRCQLVGAVGGVSYPLALYSTMDLTNVATGNVVALGSGPVFAAFFGSGWKRRRSGQVWIASTLTAEFGIALLALVRWIGLASSRAGVTAMSAARHPDK